MKVRSVIAPAAIILCVLAVFSALGVWKWMSIRAAMAAPPPPEPAEAVEVIKPKTLHWTPTSDLVGTVLAIQSVTLSSEVSGSVKEVLFESGAIVEPGQVLLRLDDSTEQADLNAAEATVTVSEASVRLAEAALRTTQSQLELAQANMRRWEPAVQAKAAAASELDRVRTELDAARAAMDENTAAIERARAQVATDKARAQQIRTNIAKKTLKAPFKARAGLRNIHPGAYLAEGSSIVNLQSISDKIYVDFAIPQEYAFLVQPGMRVNASSTALGTSSTQIEVVAMDANANPTTRNIRVRAIVDNLNDRLRPGMFVDVRVPIREEGVYLTIPTSAVRRASYGDHVFLVVPDEKDPSKLRARQRFITLGPTLGGDIVVEKGLSADEELAANGSHKLREGGPVLRGVPAPAGAPTGQPASPPTDPKT